MNELQQQISDRVNAFVDEVTRLARKAAMETLSAALSGDGGRIVRRAAAPAPAKAASAAAEPAAPSAGRRRARGKGQKRDPREIAKIQSDLAAHIQANGGQRIEQIKKIFGLDTKDLVLPVKKLLEEGAIRSEGTRRATKYYPGSGAPKAAAPAAAPARRGRPPKKK